MRSILPLSLAAAAIVFASMTAVSAQERLMTPAPAATWAPNASPSGLPKSPYRALFGPEVRVSEALQKAAAAERVARPPVVVCGMTILPADPSIDAKIFLKGAPPDTRHTIRSIPPPVCR